MNAVFLTGSGQEAVASSNGFYLDGTPPNITYLVHVDMGWSEMEPSDYQSSNTTIACIWEAVEQESEVKYIHLHVGQLVKNMETHLISQRN